MSYDNALLALQIILYLIIKKHISNLLRDELECSIGNLILCCIRNDGVSLDIMCVGYRYR